MSVEVYCKGSWNLGTACGKCRRCGETRPVKVAATVQKPSELIEPGAAALYSYQKDAVPVSVAISLRRIADAVEKIANPIHYVNSGKEIGEQIAGELEGIMHSCGQQFHRGMESH